MGFFGPDRTPSPRLAGGVGGIMGAGRKHSPWTAARNKKKNRVHDDAKQLPLYPSDEENDLPQPSAPDQEDVHMTFIEKGMQRLRVVRRGSATDHQKGRHMGPIEEAPVNSKNGAGPSPRASCPESSWAAASQSHVPLVTSLSRSFGCPGADVPLVLDRSASVTGSFWTAQGNQSAMPGRSFKSSSAMLEPGLAAQHIASGRPPLQPVIHASAEESTLRTMLRPLPVNSLSAEGLQFSFGVPAVIKPVAAGCKRRSSEPLAPSPTQQPLNSTSALHTTHSLPVNLPHTTMASMPFDVQPATPAAAPTGGDPLQGEESDGLECHEHGSEAGGEVWTEEELCEEDSFPDEDEDEEGCLDDDGAAVEFRIMTSIRPDCPGRLNRTSSGGSAGWLCTPANKGHQSDMCTTPGPNGSHPPPPYPHNMGAITPVMSDSARAHQMGYAGRNSYYSGDRRTHCTVTPASILRPAQRPRRRAPTPAGPLLGMSFCGGDEDGEEEEGVALMMAATASTPCPPSVAKTVCASGDAGAPTPAGVADSGLKLGGGRFATGAAALAAAAAALGRRGLRGHHSPVLQPPVKSKTKSKVRDMEQGLCTPVADMHEPCQPQDPPPEDDPLLNLMCDECDFFTPPHSPQVGPGAGISVDLDQIQGFVPGWVRCNDAGALDGEGGFLRGGGLGLGGMGCDEGEDGYLPVDSLSTVEEFNAQLSKAAEHGDRGRAERLWGELRTRGSIIPDLTTLNMLMRCLRKSVVHPDEAEELVSEVCALGGLAPNHTTGMLLAEMRVRFEQLVGM